MRKFAKFIVIFTGIISAIGLIASFVLALKTKGFMVFLYTLILIVIAMISAIGIYLLFNRVEDNHEDLQKLLQGKEPHQLTSAEIADQVDEEMKNSNK